MTSSAITAESVPVRCPEPVDLYRSCRLMWRAGDDLLDRWVDGGLVRMALVGRTWCAVRISQARRGSRTVHAVAAATDATTVDAGRLSEAVAGQFVYRTADWDTVLRRDPALAAAADTLPGVRPLRLSDPLYSLVRSITAQQVNLGFAVRIRARMAHRYGDCHQVDGYPVYRLNADRLAEANIDDLMEMQLSQRKAEYLIGAADAVRTGAIDPAELSDYQTDEAIARLTAFRGIGRWTADWFAARVLGRPVVVAGDLSVRKAVARHFGMDGCTEAQVRELTRDWGDSTLLAQHLVLEAPAESQRL
jgi:3-methyladenine DNA glycosylase/8-oxoguanine DNA glycosylase